MGNIISRKVKIFNNADEPIYVIDTGERGEPAYLYQGQNLASGNNANFINYIVPNGKIVELETAVCSGDGFALFELKINNNIVAKKRTYYTEYNAEFDLANLKLTETEDIKITVNNRSGEACDFDITLFYRIYDA